MATDHREREPEELWRPRAPPGRAQQGKDAGDGRKGAVMEPGTQATNKCVTSMVTLFSTLDGEGSRTSSNPREGDT